MAEIFDVVYPAVGRATFEGGLNSKYPPAIIQDNQSPDCLNVYSVNGAVESRGGSTQLNTAPIATAAIDGLYTRYDNSSNSTMVVFCAGTAWALTGASTFTTIGSAQSVFTAGVRFGAVNFLNRLYCGNGGAVPYKYDGTAFTRQGVNPPTATLSAATAATGNVNAQDWFYCYTWVNSAAVEGNVSPLNSTFTVAASSTVSLTAIGTAPQSYGVSSRRIYRATTTAGPFKLVGTINDNTTTTFTDNVGAASLTVQAPTDNGLPPNWSCVVTHQQRLFMNDASNPNYVWYSELNTPMTVKSSSFQPFGDGSFDLVKGLAVYNNSLVVLCQNSMWFWDMPSADPTQWSVIRILSQYGSKSPYASFLYDNKLMTAVTQNEKFAGFAAISQGAVTLERTKLETALAGSDRTTDAIDPDMFSVNPAQAQGISAIVFKNRAYIALPYGTSQGTNNRVYVFDFSHSQIPDQGPGYAWNPMDGVTAAQFTVYGGNLYYGDSTATGLIYQLETTSYNDNGAAQNAYFWTKEFSGFQGHENLQKDFRRVRLLIDMAGNYPMNLNYRTDSDKGGGTVVPIPMNQTVSTWGSFLWGGGQWGSGANQSEITIGLGQAQGKRIQFKFSNQNVANQRFKVHGLNFTYNVKGKR